MTVGFFSLAMEKSCCTSLAVTTNSHAYRAVSPCHLLTRSAEDTDMKVLSACEATAFAKYDLPVPGGPYNRMPFHGFRFPQKNSGWIAGRITAPINSSFAASKPATSSHLMFGFDVTIAWESWSFSFLFSSLPPPSVLGLAACFCSRVKSHDHSNLPGVSLKSPHGPSRTEFYPPIS